ncbi:hypothetical protein B1207_02525 [Legionella quinlivanii]|uniref:Uncharacterized protein n=1 Tax=Legionella quinlivanii TaxID=45073 RepID=A0A364LLZ0_9GAMM|nr:hypothetical protein [Legionella quinlivanii]RAP37882.1 hypothetical protein B1207_02525 [Legionella quinlivanii]
MIKVILVPTKWLSTVTPLYFADEYKLHASTHNKVYGSFIPSLQAPSVTVLMPFQFKSISETPSSPAIIGLLPQVTLYLTNKNELFNLSELPVADPLKDKDCQRLIFLADSDDENSGLLFDNEEALKNFTAKYTVKSFMDKHILNLEHIKPKYQSVHQYLFITGDDVLKARAELREFYGSASFDIDIVPLSKDQKNDIPLTANVSGNYNYWNAVRLPIELDMETIKRQFTHTYAAHIEHTQGTKRSVTIAELNLVKKAEADAAVLEERLQAARESRRAAPERQGSWSPAFLSTWISRITASNPTPEQSPLVGPK